MGLFGLLAGVLKFAVKSILAIIFVGILIGLLPGLPPHNWQFTAYDVVPTREFKDGLSLNNRFKNVERLFEGQLQGPETLLYHKGILYTGIYSGQVVKIVNDKIIPFIKFGKPCAGFHEEHICGRPLGLAVDKQDNLYVADTYYGLFKVNISNKVVEQLVSLDTDIEGRKPKLFNSVIISSDGIVYWTDADSNVKLHDGVFSMLADGTGRLIKYDPATKINTVLIDRIRFANGVAFSPDESFIVVSETFQYRLLRYYLKGPKKGTWDVFVDGLPGCPDNLKADSRGYFYVPLVLPRDKEITPLPLYNLHKYPLVKKALVRSLLLLEMFFTYSKQIFPEQFCEKAIYKIGNFQPIQHLLTLAKRFTLVVMNKDGRIINSYHSLDGSLNCIGDVEPVGEYLYFGSPFNGYLGRAKLPAEFKSS